VSFFGEKMEAKYAVPALVPWTLVLARGLVNALPGGFGAYTPRPLMFLVNIGPHEKRLC